jgi:hypothetical protein
MSATMGKKESKSVCTQFVYNLMTSTIKTYFNINVSKAINAMLV